MVMWPKFHNSSISIKEVIVVSILKVFGRRNTFQRVVLGQVQQFRNGARYGLAKEWTKIFEDYFLRLKKLQGKNW